MLSRTIKILILIYFVFFITQCTTVYNSNEQHKSSAEYLSLANKQTGKERQETILLAAERLIQEKQFTYCKDLLQDTPFVDPTLKDERTILLAKLNLAQNFPRKAISNLSHVKNTDLLPNFYQIQFHETLAKSYELLAKKTEAIDERIRLEKLLTDSNERIKNNQALWATLNSLPKAEIEALAMESANENWSGWLQLALLDQNNISQVDKWKKTYPQHAGNTVLNDSNNLDNSVPGSKRIALLIPTTGPLAGPGNAIKDGFMQSVQDHNANQKIRFYNTDNANVADLYKQAIQDGADFVVGPLSKPQAAIVAQLPHPVPTLLLNEVNSPLTKGAYQFGLSLNNEAKQVAIKAREMGYSQALIIAPSGMWGKEIVSAFNTEWQQNQGKTVGTLFYQEHEDLNSRIRDFLGITDSNQRNKDIKNMLGYHLETVPSRRQDFDVIFLLAYPSKARQIMPLLKYYYAGDIPVFATSTTYAGSINAMKDKDLNGIIFCDMPWIFNHQLAQKNWPEQLNSYSRLYALGMDSYTLTSKLDELTPETKISEKSGVLYLKDSQIIRLSTWGQFKAGVPQELG